MKTDNIEDSQEIDPPISKGLNEVGSRTGNNEDRPLVRLVTIEQLRVRISNHQIFQDAGEITGFSKVLLALLQDLMIVHEPLQSSEPHVGIECDKCDKQTDEVNLVGHCGECVNAKFNCDLSPEDLQHFNENRERKRKGLAQIAYPGLPVVL